MTTTLASINRLAAFLPGRDNPLTMDPALRGYLTTATALILSYTGMVLSDAEQVYLLDTPASYRAATGLASPEFSRAPYPVFDLPVSGPLTGLVVKYRGGAIYDEHFTWDDVEPLITPTHYVYEEATGRIRLRFLTSEMMHGLRVSFTATAGSKPDVIVGEERRSLMASIGLQTDLTPPGALFTGVEHKGVSACPSVTGNAPTLASITLQPPQLTTLHRVRLIGPRDGTILGSGQPTTVRLIGVPATGPEEALHEISSPNPLPMTTYTLEGSQTVAYSSYRIEVAGAATDTVRLSFVDPSFAHPVWRHMEGYVAPEVSEACAMLAFHLYQRGNLDGIGKGADATGRGYSGVTSIPQDVKDLLRQHVRRGSGVTFI